MHAFVCESCWVIRGRPKVLNKITRIIKEIICFDCGAEAATLFIKVK